MHLHILGICGTFMGGIARLAIEKGYKVTGSDKNCYPPMSEQLEDLGIQLSDGEDPSCLKDNPDSVVVGNSLSRGNPVIESMLNTNQFYTSGPQWLKENILQDKWVIAVAGTHGKTTTASMVVWILESLGYNPSFLVGGVMASFGVSARLTDSPFFIVEADEYDTAFFDKRSKFVHYRARTCILNNLEFDHADIFDDLSAIENQFHHLVRCIPENGLIIKPSNTEAIDRVIARGCWTPLEVFNPSEQINLSGTEESLNSIINTKGWSAKKTKSDGSDFDVYFDSVKVGSLQWNLIGNHNVNNALAAIAAARHVGVNVADAIDALAKFKNVRRRLELKGTENEISVYDDFAHHPTSIQSTLEGLRCKVGQTRIIAIVDIRSNTMKMGCHKDRLIESIKDADSAIFHIPDNYESALSSNRNESIIVKKTISEILEFLKMELRKGDHVLVMSNGSFGGIHDKILTQIRESN